MADFGGIPSDVISELAGVGKKAITDAAKAFADIAVGTAETVSASNSGSSQVGSGGGKGDETGISTNDPMAAMKQQKQAAANRRLSEVRAELEEFYQMQKRKKQQEEQVEEEQKMQEKQFEESKKKQEERSILQRLSGQYGGTGEVGKGGN